MNANKRMKYASTPTYGMQKRGFQRGQTAAAPQASMPDFTQLPVPEVPTIPMPGQQQAVGAFMPSGAFPSGSGPFAPTGTLLPPTSFFGGQAMPPMGTMPMQSQPVYGNPSFLQSTPMQSAPLHGGSPMVSQHSQPLPLGNAPMVNAAQAAAFSPRQQGYVPPAQQLAPPPLAQNAGPGMGYPQGDPLLSAYRPPYTTPMASTPFMPSQMPAGANQAMPNPYLNSMTGNPAMNGPANSMQQPMMPAQQAAYPPSAPKAARGPMDLNKGLMYFLFGALPLLFIPCLFVPSAWDFLRYAFIVLCVIGIGLMWYRQLFTPNARATVTILYAALCIVTISMMLSGNRDVQTTGANGISPTQETAPSPTPDSLAAGIPSQEPEETPSPISAPGQSEAEKRLISFMEFWSADRVDEMVSLVQPSWASAQTNPNSELFYIKANRTPTSYTIESISGTDADNSRTVQLSAYIYKNDAKEDTRYRFRIIMNKEGGEWYVDPQSLQTNDVVTSSLDPDSTPVPKNAETPRTTVTPVPPPNTKLYYNPNGGSFYHADQNCDSVNSEFLPLQGSFLYSDLKEYQKQNYQPCLKCNAPVNAASE